MGKFIDLTGQRFGKLTVIKRVDNYNAPNGSTCAKWECKCDCGNVIFSVSTPLIKGRTKSCGCYHLETIKKAIDVSNRRIQTVHVSSLIRKKKEHTSSKYKGVYLNKKTGRYYSQITLNEKTIGLGTYISEEDAHRSRIIAEKILHLPFLMKDGNLKKEKFLIEDVGLSEEEARKFTESNEIQSKIEKALEIIEAS